VEGFLLLLLAVLQAVIAWVALGLASVVLIEISVKLHTFVRVFGVFAQSDHVLLLSLDSSATVSMGYCKVDGHELSHSWP